MPRTDRMAGVENTTLRNIPVPYWFNGRLPDVYPIFTVILTGEPE